MTTFSEAISADLAVFFNLVEFGRSAVYRVHATGEEKAVTVVFSFQDGFTTTEWPGGIAQAAEVYVKKSDVSAPAVHDQVTIDNQEWTVTGILGDAENLWQVSVARDFRPR